MPTRSYKITKENNGEDISFTIACLYSGIINLAEFKQWLYKVIDATEVGELPFYIWDLIELEEGQQAKITQIMEFTPYINLTKEQYAALTGMALKRFPNVGSDYDLSIPRAKALKAFEKSPSLLEKVKEEFSFIEDLQRIG